VYPPVRGFCENYLKPRGIDHRVYNPGIGAGIAELLDAHTKLVWVESPGSTTMEIQDVPAIVTAANQRGALVGCDNTWATPLLFKPLAHGVDFAMEALTKYVGGHSDLLMGSVTVADLSLHRRLKETMRMLGLGVSPDDCALALRGIETMGVRLAHMGRVAADFAARLEHCSGVARVLHPSLPSFSGHALWKRDFKGASGLFSIILEPAVGPQLDAALSNLEFFSLGASWGGTRSLIVPMAIKADRTATPWHEEGVILRISIGLEDPDDLWSDLSRLLHAIENAKVA
jgi:cystathionine beta-lyase